jgi:membrane-associated phospholipid phosphatase
MTWHAATFLVTQIGLLAIAAVAFYLVWMMPHRGRHWLRSWEIGSGLRLSVGAVVVILSAFLFVHILRGVLTDATLAEADLRLHNTVRLFRSEVLHKRYSAVSRAASTAFVVPVVIALATMAWVAGRRREAVFVLAALILQAVLSIALKYTVHRPRPPDAIPLHLGPSFPSGHTLAATVVYGFLVYLMLRDQDRREWLLIPSAVLVALIVFVPVSRVYLGVHWPYDTIASLALGLGLLAILITLFKYPPIEHRILDSAPDQSPWFARTMMAAILLAVGAAWCFGYMRELPEARPQPLPVLGSVPLSSLQTFPRQLKKTSEDLIGGPMEPVALMFVGSPERLRSAFERAGWELADTPSVSGLARELLAVIEDAPDPHAPATPAYYEAQPQDFTFERPGTPSRSIRRRHHTRIWRAPLLVDPNQQPLWVATCSYDAGVEFVFKPYLITHRIDPDVDQEREMIAAQLRAVGARDATMVAVTGPQRGRNAGGDSFFTDGRARVLLLP